MSPYCAQIDLYFTKKNDPLFWKTIAPYFEEKNPLMFKKLPFNFDLPQILQKCPAILQKKSPDLVKNSPILPKKSLGFYQKIPPRIISIRIITLGWRSSHPGPPLVTPLRNSLSISSRTSQILNNKRKQSSHCFPLYWLARLQMRGF